MALCVSTLDELVPSFVGDPTSNALWELLERQAAVSWVPKTFVTSRGVSKTKIWPAFSAWNRKPFECPVGFYNPGHLWMQPLCLSECRELELSHNSAFSVTTLWQSDLLLQSRKLMHKLLLWSSTLPAFGFTVSSIALLLTAHTRVVQRLTFLSVIKLFASVSPVLHEKALPFFLSLISTSDIYKKSDFSPCLLFEQLTAGCSVSFLFFLWHPTTSNSISS